MEGGMEQIWLAKPEYTDSKWQKLSIRAKYILIFLLKHSNTQLKKIFVGRARIFAHVGGDYRTLKKSLYELRELYNNGEFIRFDYTFWSTTALLINLYDLPVSFAEKVFLYVLSDKTYTITEIKDLTGFSRAKVWQCINNLKKLDVIIVEHKNGRTGTRIKLNKK